MDIKEKFKKVSIKHNKIILYHSKDAIKVIEECRCQNRNIYGIDAFKLYENNTKIQPFMEHSIDFSVNGVIGGYWDEAIDFINRQTDEELVFEIVYEQQKTLNAKKKIVIGAIFVIAILMIFLYFGLHGTIWGISKSENSTSEYLDEWIIQLIGLIIIFAIVIFAFGISVIRKKKADKKLDEDTRQRNKKVNRYFIVWIITVAVIININPEIGGYLFIIPLFALYGIGFVVSIFHSRFLRKVEIGWEILLNYCDTNVYIKSLEKVKKIPILPASTRYRCELQLAYGYIYAGEFEKVKELIISMSVNKVVEKNISYKASLSILILELYIATEDLIEARKAFNDVEKQLNTLDMTIFEKGKNISIIEFYKRKINALEVDYNDLELLLLEQLEKTEIILHKVVLKYELARTYLKMNRKKEAMELLDYVLKNGGNTYYAKESKKLIF